MQHTLLEKCEDMEDTLPIQQKVRREVGKTYVYTVKKEMEDEIEAAYTVRKAITCSELVCS